MLQRFQQIATQYLDGLLTADEFQYALLNAATERTFDDTMALDLARQLCKGA